jgi:hypothetical protein
MEVFHVHDPVPAVVCPIGARRLLDRVESEPDSRIAGGVGVDLETHPVQFPQHVDEFTPRVAGTAPHTRPVGVVVEHQRGVRLDDVVGVELDRAEPQHRIGRRAVDRGPQARAERAVGADRMEEGGDHPRGEHPLAEGTFEQRQLAKRHLGFDDRRDAERGGHPHAGSQLPVPALG